MFEDTGTHKGLFAHVAVLEGDPEKWGASRLAAYAALRAGAGLVTLLVENPLQQAPGDLPEFMKEKISQTKLNHISSLVVGPGIVSRSKLKQARLLIKMALAKNIAVILDAGALELLPAIKKLPQSKSVVIATPHPGEAAGLLQTTAKQIQNDREEATKQLLALSHPFPTRIIWVLKGAGTLIAETGQEPVLCPGNVSTLATCGSGDVLSGAIAGSLHPGAQPFETVHRIIEAHLQAGRRLMKKNERGHLAHEIADELGRVLF